MIYYLDTNCILRFLTNDVPHQAEKIEKRFRGAEKGRSTFTIPHIVVVETLFQLEHWYKQSRKEAAQTLMTFLSPEWIHVEQKEILLACLEDCKLKNIDIVDLMLFHFAEASTAKILSFDHDFDALSPNLREEP